MCLASRGELAARVGLFCEENVCLFRFLDSVNIIFINLDPIGANLVSHFAEKFNLLTCARILRNCFY